MLESLAHNLRGVPIPGITWKPSGINVAIPMYCLVFLMSLFDLGLPSIEACPSIEIDEVSWYWQRSWVLTAFKSFFLINIENDVVIVEVHPICLRGPTHWALQWPTCFDLLELLYRSQFAHPVTQWCIHNIIQWYFSAVLYSLSCPMYTNSVIKSVLI